MKGIIILCMLLLLFIGFAIGFVFFEVGTTIAYRRARAEAVQNGVAEYGVTEKGEPKFVWKKPCTHKKEGK